MPADSSIQTPIPSAVDALPPIGAVVEQWLKPKVAKRRDADKLQALLTKFEEYLEASYTRHSYLSVLVFKNQQRRLEELYIPLAVISAKDNTNIKIDGYHDYFIPKYEKVLITDTAGMGKSTVLRYLFIACLRANKGFPIFVELRKLSKELTILDYLATEIGEPKEFLERLFRQGDFIFFLDGYDEIPYEEREQITSALQNFVSKAGKNLFVLTSRPEVSLVTFSDFQEFKIKALDLEEAFNLIKKYDSAGELSDRIIDAIKSGRYENIKEFLTNPLLVSLLYKSYEFKPKIPFKKHIFYRQVYDALFEAHDLSKPGAPIRRKKSGLDIDDFHRILRSLGYITVNLGKVEYGKDEILQLISKAKERCPGLDFKTAQLLDDLLTTVPLFLLSGDSFKWAHKAIQEYFAAQYICVDAKDKQAKILRSIYRSEGNERYINVLDLCYDIDYKTFRNTIIYELLNDFVNHYEKSYEGFDGRAIEVQAIHDRKTLTFGYFYVFDPKRDEKPSLFSRWFRFSTLTRVKELFDTLKKEGKLSHEYKIAFKNFRIFGRRIPIVEFQNQVPPVLSLLSAKNEEIFAKSPDMHSSGAAIPEVDITETTIINDDPASKVNSDSNFSKINTLIFFFIGSTQPSLDITKSRLLKQKIKEEIAQEEESDLLLGAT